MTQRLFLLLFSLMLGFAAKAQFTPQGFNYQCIVRDDKGNPAKNQTVTLVFSIRSGTANGPLAYSEKQVTSTNEYGLVNLVIGQGGTPLAGTFAGINWGANAKYLTVSVQSKNDPNVFQELGTSQMMSVPYALYAGNGGSGQGDDWGKQTAITGPTLSGNGTASSPLAIAQQGAQNGQLLKWDGSSWVPANDNDTNSGGTVTQISTGVGLVGGPITKDGIISLAPTGVVPDTYGSATQIPVIQVDATGRITQIGTVALNQPNPVVINAGAGVDVQQNGTTFTISNTGDLTPNDDLIGTTQFSGDVSGVYFDLQLRPGTVTSVEVLDNSLTGADILDNSIGVQDIQNNAIVNAKIADGAVTGAKIDGMGATNGQVLKWNGTTWAPAADNSGSAALNLSAGPAISITGTAPNLTINNTGDTNPADDVTTNSGADGDITGIFSNLQVKPGVINTLELGDQAVTGQKIDDMGATNGQVLKWNGTTWVPSADNAGSASLNLTAGTAISITGTAPNLTINNTGDPNANDDVTTVTGADGDITGIYSNLQIKTFAVGTLEIANSAVTGAKLDQMGATNGQVLKWNGFTWAPAADNGGGSVNITAGAGINVTQAGGTYTIINTGDLNATDDLTNASIADGDVSGPFNNLQLKAGVVTSNELANNAVTTNAVINGAITGAKINNMGAGVGQVLKYNGNIWAPANDETGAAGTNVVTNQTLIGNGTAANPLGIAPQGALNGQVLKFNGVSWVPANEAAGDNWGTQAVVTNPNLTGNGTVANPLSIAQQGATPGQVLRWNGTSWQPANVTGDNWGTQTVATTPVLSGQGINANPLTLAQQGAAPGQVLKWNGATWLPGDDQVGGGTGNNYTAGPGISITGTAPNFTISNTGDTDNDITNELQQISIAGNTISLSKGGGSVNLPVQNNYTAGTGISITGTAPNLTINNTGDADKDPLNEMQTLSLTGPVLSISGSNSSVDLTPLIGPPSGFWTLNGTDISNINTGNVLIGTTNNSGKLQVVSSNGQETAFFIQNSATAVPAIVADNSGDGTAALLSSAKGPALITKEGNVGIHTDAPAFRLDVDGDARVKAAGVKPHFTVENAGLQYARLALSNASPSSWNIVGRGSGNSSDFGIEFIKGAGVGLRVITARMDSGIVIGYKGTTSSTRVLHGENGFFLENIGNNRNWEFRVSPINGTLALYNDQLGFVPAGTFAINGVYTPSDSRLKKDIEAMDDDITEKLLQLHPVSYRYKAEENDAKPTLGFLAEEVQGVFPELVGESENRNGQGSYLSLNYSGFGVLAVKAVQEQQTEIERLKQEKLGLAKQVEALEARLKRLEEASVPKK